MDSTMVLYTNECELLAVPSGKWAGSEDEPTEENDDIGTLRLYPNPNNGEFTLAFSNCGDSEALYKLTIADITGKQVFERTITCGQQSLDMSTLDNGTYLLRVVSANGNERWNYKLLLLK